MERDGKPRKRSKTAATPNSSQETPEKVVEISDNNKKDSSDSNKGDKSSQNKKIKKEKSRKEKDKIIVSKLAKSDRPHRERSPEKSKEVLRTINEIEDYRLSLNKPSTTSTLDRKTLRSISQPNPPSNLSELTNAYNYSTNSSNGSHSSRVSAINKKQLKRSSTAREHQTSTASTDRIPRISENKSNTLRLHSSDSKNRFSSNNDLTVFDNLGYDKSPSGLTSGSSGSESLGAIGTLNSGSKQRQRRISSGSHSLSEQLREQLESQLRRERGSSNYSLMELTSLSDSDCSSEDKRKSPPTQTQSLSEESCNEAAAGGGGSHGRRTARNSIAGGGTNPFSWDTDFSEGETTGSTAVAAGSSGAAAWPGGPKDVPITGWEKGGGDGGGGEISKDDIGWDTEDEGSMPQFAANMYVRLPNSVTLQSPENSLSGKGYI